MTKFVLDYVNKCESWKTAIKQLHWAANSLSQHELCDDIAELISGIQDRVSEIEQSLSGRFPIGSLSPESYKASSLKQFVTDVISDTQEFRKKLEASGERYIGIKSDVEGFIGDMQQKMYLVDFTLKENLKEKLRKQMNEELLTINDGRNIYQLSEDEMKEMVSEAISNIRHRIN